MTSELKILRVIKMRIVAPSGHELVLFNPLDKKGNEVYSYTKKAKAIKAFMRRERATHY